ncbi:unnamed protein product [Rhizoctonia solani]|uniref:Uncharacterized protein n=1 Tax=Rhizoctonia solani TaxID=456999 RepID=A0A8H3D3X5_9AGAM|nr:unnamed protein product [Rhizoctonia solani]
MLFALPLIAAAVVSYIQFAFIRDNGYKWFQPMMWEALEDLKGIMRRRMPLWMMSISAGIPRLMLPAPIPFSGLCVDADDDQALMAVPSHEETQGTYSFDTFFAAMLTLCLTIVYTVWILSATSTSKVAASDHQRNPIRKPRLVVIVYHPAAPSPGILAPVSELVSPDQAIAEPRNSVPSPTRILGPIHSSLPIVPNVLGSRVTQPLLNSAPAIANESIWRELRVPSSNAMNTATSGYWRRVIMVIERTPYNSAQLRMAHRKYKIGYGTHSAGADRGEETGTGFHSTSSGLPAIRDEPLNTGTPFIPRTTVEGQQLSTTSSVDLPTRTERQIEPSLKMGSPQDVPPAVSETSDLEVTKSGLVASLDTGISAVCTSSTGSTSLEAPELIEYSKSTVGCTLDLLQTRNDLGDREENLVSGCAASTAWGGLVALRDSLARPLSNPDTRTVVDESTPLTEQDTGDHSSFDSFHHDNAWANDDTDSLEPFLTNGSGITLEASNPNNANAYDYSKCNGRLCTSSDSFTSIGSMSCSSSTRPDTPLITPSSSMPQVSRGDEISCAEGSLDAPVSSTDFVFGSQLSQTAPSSPPIQHGASSMDTGGLNSLPQVQANGFSPANSDMAPTPNLSPESPALQCFLDDRTYAEVAGVPSPIESARATFSLSRWRVPRLGPRRPQPNGPSLARSVLDMVPGSWAGYGTVNNVWARSPDSNSCGFENRRERGKHA